MEETLRIHGPLIFLMLIHYLDETFYDPFEKTMPAVNISEMKNLIR
jgi:hypothetical protein